MCHVTHIQGYHELNTTTQTTMMALEAACETLAEMLPVDGVVTEAAYTKLQQEHISALAGTAQLHRQYQSLLELGKSHAGHLKATLTEVNILGTDSTQLQDPAALDAAQGILIHIKELGERLHKQHRGVKFNIVVDSTLQMLAESSPIRKLLVHCDLSKCRSIIGAFITNAFKFIPAHKKEAGTGVVEVEVMLATPDSQVTTEQLELVHKGGCIPLRFSIKDNGAGIPEDQMATIFEPGGQLRRGELQGGGGSGFGLWLAKDYAHAMGGTVAVNSTLHEGSEFCFYITLNLVEQDPNPNPYPNPNPNTILPSSPPAVPQQLHSAPQQMRRSSSFLPHGLLLNPLLSCFQCVLFHQLRQCSLLP